MQRLCENNIQIMYNIRPAAVPERYIYDARGGKEFSFSLWSTVPIFSFFNE